MAPAPSYLGQISPSFCPKCYFSDLGVAAALYGGYQVRPQRLHLVEANPRHHVLAHHHRGDEVATVLHGGFAVTTKCRRFNGIVSQLKMHYFSEGAFESLIASQLLKKEKYI